MYNRERITNSYKLVFYTFGFAFVLIGVLLLTKNSREKEIIESTCNVVETTKHVYRGDCLPEGYVPEDLVPLSPRASWLTTEPKLTLKAKVMVEQLIEEAENDGMCLVVTSGYRSVEEQQTIYDNTPEDRKDYVALPGSSEHQTGLAVDFTACPTDTDGKRDDSIERDELTEDFENLPEYRWLLFNAERFGFHQSFMTANIEDTGYAPESWHWMFMGE